MLLLDAGVWIAAKDRADRFFDPARALVLDPARPVAALDLTYYEVANVVGARWRAPKVARELTRTISARCGGQVATIDSGLVELSLELLGRHGLTAYDAAYVAVAEQHGWTLVSTDVTDLVSKGLAVTPDGAGYP